MVRDSYAGLFSCGTVEYIEDEKAGVQHGNYPKGGDYTGNYESMNFQFGG